MATDRYPVWDLRVDWNNDGNFTTAGDDVTTRFLSRDSLAIGYGRDTARALAPTSPGQMAFSLNNISRDYSCDNASSPLAGNLVPGRPVRAQATQDATTSVMYRGFTDGYDVLPSRAERSVKFTCLDALGRLAGASISTELYAGKRTGTLIGYVLDAVGWGAGARDIDIGATIVPWWWEENGDALTALRKLLYAEGPPAICYVDTSGSFVFRDRFHRYQHAASSTVQATFTNAGAEPRFSEGAVYDAGWRDIVNTVTVNCDIREQQIPVIIWETTKPFYVANGATVDIAIASSEPFNWMAAPVEVTAPLWTGGTSWHMVQWGTVTVSLSRTCGQSTVLSFTGGGGTGGVVSEVHMWAWPVTVARTVQVSVADATSVAAYGARGLPAGVDLSWCDPEHARTVAGIYLSRYAQRRPTITIPLANRNAATLEQILTRDLSDRVHVTDTQTGLDADCHIERQEYAVSQGGRVVRAMFACEKAPTEPANVFVFDDATDGKFNTGKFGA